MLNYDDDPSRRVTEFCIRTGKAIQNPIIDWEEEDVWEFLNRNGIEHCCLYDEGFTRLGCIGCPMGRRERMIAEFDRWPKYKELYLKAFGRMLKERENALLPTEWETPEEVMEWWLGNENG